VKRCGLNASGSGQGAVTGPLTVGFHARWGIPLPGEALSASQEGLCSMEIVYSP